MIKLKNVTLGYDNNIILKNININIKEGSYVAVLGENGSGKSTLIKGILGLLKPKKGTIEFTINKNEIGYLPQTNEDNSFFPASVYEIVLSGFLNVLGHRFFYTKKQKEIVIKTLRRLKIENLKNKCFKELSGGQKQRVLLARAIISGKKVLVLDEPVSGLDYKTINDMYSIIDDLNKEGMTIIMISHDLDKMIEHASDILMLKEKDYIYLSTKEFISESNHECFGDHIC